MGDSKAEKDATSVLDSLYRDYILRDYFAKVVPGACLLFAGAYAANRHATLLGASLLMGIFLGGLSWILGFAVQQVAEWAKILRQHPERYSEQGKRYQHRIDFNRQASTEEIVRVERYAVIKEATGNTATAIVIGMLLVLTGRAGELVDAPLPTLAAAGALVLGALVLGRTSRQHTEKEYSYIEEVLKQERPDSRNEPAEP